MSGPAVRRMRSDEREPFLDLVEAAFGKRDEFARYLDADGVVGPGDTWLALDGDRPVSSVQIFDKPIRLRGAVATIGGIGSVATHPDYERRGLATQLLRRAIEDMRARGHALSLLFTARTSFYERLDWFRIPHSTWTLKRSAEPARVDARPLQRADLDAVARLYERYNRDADGAVVRDAGYWIAQLGYAGEPEEDFRVIERDGRIVAYARRIEFFGIPRVTEHACEPGAAGDLARLLHAWTPRQGALVAQRTGDAELARALRTTPGLAAEPGEWGDAMWRVIDRARIPSLRDAERAMTDADLLHALVGPDSAVFWPSDRF